MTVFLGIPKRCAAMLLVTAMGAMPMGLTASISGVEQTQAAKPSPDVAGAASLPATQPTGTAGAAKPAHPPEQHLSVDFTDGKITVNATNASLNGVLREIAAKASIKVIGGVSDERVFGQYGPAVPGVILAQLLEGTASNMLLVDDANGASQLVLTPRIGGPTPPNPLAAALEAADEERPASRYVPPPRQFQPQGQGRGPMAVPPSDSSVPPERQGASRPDVSQPGNDARTPQQIYDQLQNANQKQSEPQQPQ